MYRSFLYVPASSERFIAKAATSGADAVCLDLEDGVAPSEKIRARLNLALAVPTCGARGSDVWVRINRPLSQAVLDIGAAVRSNATGIFITKAESAEHVRLLLEVAAEAEAEDVSRQIRQAPLKAIAMIETCAAIPRAGDIACAHPAVIGLLGGGEDLAKEMGANSSEETLRMPKLLIHIAAKGAGIHSFGTLGSVADYSNPKAISDLAMEARRHGFSGATCIHPSIVALLNTAFTPTVSEIDNAKALIAQASASFAAGTGAFTFQGRMVDEPIIEKARRLIARSELLQEKGT